MIKMIKTVTILFTVLTALASGGQLAQGQNGQRDGKMSGGAKPVTVPVTIRLREPKREVEMRFVDLIIKEDGDLQTILSIRKPSENPITLAILLQDDLVPSIATETNGVAGLVRRLQPGSRVMTVHI